jgi:hypothetical protein
VGVGWGVGVGIAVATGVGLGATAVGAGITVAGDDGPWDGVGLTGGDGVGSTPALHAARITPRIATTVACLADMLFCPPQPDAPV